MDLKQGGASTWLEGKSIFSPQTRSQKGEDAKYWVPKPHTNSFLPKYKLHLLHNQAITNGHHLEWFTDKFGCLESFIHVLKLLQRNMQRTIFFQLEQKQIDGCQRNFFIPKNTAKNQPNLVAKTSTAKKTCAAKYSTQATSKRGKVQGHFILQKEQGKKLPCF